MPYTLTDEGLKGIQEAARRGSRTKSEGAKSKYAQAPKKCLQCGKVLEWSKRRGKFCSSTCAATMNNRLIPKRQAARKQCLVCGNQTNNS